MRVYQKENYDIVYKVSGKVYAKWYHRDNMDLNTCKYVDQKCRLFHIISFVFVNCHLNLIEILEMYKFYERISKHVTYNKS